jgi:VIT1/CCC1 family predicted Fe2+/Mn2+ transporter
MKESIKTGISFGLPSGVITTLGLIIGLHSGTHSKLAVVGGIIVIAIADALSDALGIHIHEESENVHDAKQVWTSTFATFLSKLLTALTFLIPVLFLDLSMAIIVSVIWGLLILSILSYHIARMSNVRPWNAVFEHLIIAVAVIIISHLVGKWVSNVFG